MSDDMASRVENHEQRITTMERELDVQQNTCKLTVERTFEAMERNSDAIKDATQIAEKSVESVNKNTKWTVGLLISLFIFLPAVFAILIKVLK